MTDYQRIEKVIRYLQASYQTQPSLQTLAKVAGLSEFHFQRLFSRWTGTTPKTFLQFLTSAHAKELLLQSRDLLSTSLDTGLSGPSRLHDLFVNLEAVTPGEFKAQGQGLEIKYGFHDSPFGDCLIGLTNRGICYFAFFDTRPQIALADLQSKWPQASLKIAKTLTAKTVREIFNQPRGKKISLLVSGTKFQVKVWEALLKIPEGSVVSYNQLAQVVGSPKAARAVGSAVGKNCIAFLIPCHRVIKETGIFGEYRWGTNRKAALLNWEMAKKSS